LAEKRGIRISDQDVKDNVKRKMEEYGSEELVKKDLVDHYGWTISDFEEKVVAPSMYREALEKEFKKEDSSRKSSEEKAKKAKEVLLQGKAFADVVKEYSQGDSAKNGGELGWFKKEQIIPDIAEKVFTLKKGEQSDVLESELGFHIIEVKNQKEEGGIAMVEIRQLFIEKKTFPDWLGEEMRKISFRVFLKDYFWNQEQQFADFRSEEMRNFEEKVRKSPLGDPSVMF
jgi:parvulin-like peptidyl-prolyl isomerase